MKKLYLFILVFIFWGCTGPKITPGINDGNAPIKTQIIVVESQYDADMTYKHIGKILNMNGFSIANSDKELKTITTDYREIEATVLEIQSYQAKFTFSIVEGNPVKVYVSGKVKYQYMSPNTHQMQTEENNIEKYGQTKSVIRKSWKKMFELSEEIGKPVEFKQ